MTRGVPEEFWQGVEQFNRGQFYTCHDSLEALWMEASEPEKTFYQGILQIAVALYHLGNCNWRGAVVLLGEGMNKLRRYPAIYSEIDVDALLTSAAALLTALQQAGPEKIADWVESEDAALALPSIERVDRNL